MDKFSFNYFSISTSKISAYKHLDRDLQRHAGLFTSVSTAIVMVTIVL